MLPVSGTEAGRDQISRGAGGDVTVELDRLAEATAVSLLEQVAARGERFSLLSEEIGRRDFGAEFPLVLMDPVDGSLNAKQGIPVFAIMLSLLDSGSVSGVRVGHVTNLATGQTWEAVRGQGARLDGETLKVLPSARAERIECLGLESSPRSLAAAAPLVATSGKLRILGSMALSLCHTAAGGLDVFCCPIQGRVFDMTASLLVLREAGGTATDLAGSPIDDKKVDLGSRTTLLAASDAQVHAHALRLLTPGRD